MNSGPPSVPPNWFCLKSGFGRFARLLKKLLASNASLRWNSKALPRKALVPDLICRLTTPPSDRPNSAE